MRIGTIKIWAACLMMWWLSGCGGGAVPNRQLVDAESAIRAAQEAGATGNPKAQLHLTLAERQVSKAKLFMLDGDNRKAALILTRALSDAELAIALAHEQVARAEAQEALKNLEELRAQLKQLGR